MVDLDCEIFEKEFSSTYDVFLLILTISEKMQIAKQRNIASSKRGDKRTCRIPKSRSDTFSLKNGLVSFGTVSGGGNIPGITSMP